MKNLIEVWKSVYHGNPSWLKYEYPTLSGKKCSRTRKTLKAGYMVCSELASLLWAEMPDFTASDYVQSVLNGSAFWDAIKTQSEYMIALGGMALKLYIENSQVKIDYIPADRFVPVTWDASGVSEADFIDRRIEDKKQIVRIERHRIKPGGYSIESEEYEEIAGERRPTHKEIVKQDVPVKMFVYVKNPMVNNFDLNSAYGLSLFANSLDTLESLDVAFDALQSEIVLGRKRIIVPSGAVRFITDPETGKPIKYFDPADEVFQAFAGDDLEKLKITDNTSELRIEDIRLAIKTMLELLCIQIGFNTGTLSFDGQSMKTATEVISENSKTFKTKKTYEQAIGAGILELINLIRRVYAWLENAKDTVDPILEWDDSVVEDRNSLASYVHERLQNNTLELWRALMWLDGIEETEARQRAEELAKSRQVVNFDDILGGL